MNILIACEESQKVCSEFRKLGHVAYSCDIQEPSGGHPEWHINDDVLPLLNGDCTFSTMDGTKHSISGKWDMLIAFPPCTHLALSGAMHFEKKRNDGRQRDGIEFFCRFFDADCDRIVIENPKNIISGGEYIRKWFPDLAEKYKLPRKYSQVIHPWMFGDPYCKGTCLWIKGLPNLIPDITEEPETEWVEYISKKGKKKRIQKWYSDAFTDNQKDSAARSRIRSKTFDGIAKAMATQWSNFCELSEDQKTKLLNLGMSHKQLKLF